METGYPRPEHADHAGLDAGQGSCEGPVGLWTRCRHCGKTGKVETSFTQREVRTSMLLSLRSHHNKHKWVSSGITRDGHYRLQCRCGAVLLRPIWLPEDGTGVEGEPEL